MKEKDVMILTGAGQIGMTIARRMGYGMKIVVGDKRKENADAVTELLMSRCGALITGADFLVDGGATAGYFYGALQTESASSKGC